MLKRILSAFMPPIALGIGDSGTPAGFVDRSQTRNPTVAGFAPTTTTFGSDAFRRSAEQSLLNDISGANLPFGGPGGVAATQALANQAIQPVLSQFTAAGRGPGRSGLAQAAIAQQAALPFAARFGEERQLQQNAARLGGELEQTQTAPFFNESVTQRDPFFQDKLSQILSLGLGGAGLLQTLLGGGQGGALGGVGGLLGNIFGGNTADAATAGANVPLGAPGAGSVVSGGSAGGGIGGGPGGFGLPQVPPTPPAGFGATVSPNAGGGPPGLGNLGTQGVTPPNFLSQLPGLTGAGLPGTGLAAGATPGLAGFGPGGIGAPSIGGAAPATLSTGGAGGLGFGGLGLGGVLAAAAPLALFGLATGFGSNHPTGVLAPIPKGQIVYNFQHGVEGGTGRSIAHVNAGHEAAVAALAAQQTADIQRLGLDPIQVKRVVNNSIQRLGPDTPRVNHQNNTLAMFDALKAEYGTTKANGVLKAFGLPPVTSASRKRIQITQQTNADRLRDRIQSGGGR